MNPLMLFGVAVVFRIHDLSRSLVKWQRNGNRLHGPAAHRDFNRVSRAGQTEWQKTHSDVLVQCRRPDTRNHPTAGHPTHANTFYSKISREDFLSVARDAAALHFKTRQRARDSSLLLLH